nr:MAG TPA: hypothetical protein [Caudoviricetes sp.]
MLGANECGEMFAEPMGSIKYVELHNIVVTQVMLATVLDYQTYIKKSNSLKI